MARPHVPGPVDKEGFLPSTAAPGVARDNAVACVTPSKGPFQLPALCVPRLPGRLPGRAGPGAGAPGTPSSRGGRRGLAGRPGDPGGDALCGAAPPGLPEATVTRAPLPARPGPWARPEEALLSPGRAHGRVWAERPNVTYTSQNPSLRVPPHARGVAVPRGPAPPPRPHLLSSSRSDLRSTSPEGVT